MRVGRGSGGLKLGPIKVPAKALEILQILWECSAKS